MDKVVTASRAARCGDLQLSRDLPTAQLGGRVTS
jgi:hypothetical protein